MKIIILSFFTGFFLLSGCIKEGFTEIKIPTETNCFTPIEEPISSNYSCADLVPVNYPGVHCGFLPLSLKNYWVYEDSFFNNGSFQRVQYDTLRFKTTYRSATDNIIWWESNMEIGLPALLFSNENGIFQLQKRLFSNCTWESNKEFILPAGDSSKYLARFDDIAAQGRSVRLTNIASTPAGDFSNCILFEKNSRNFRKDQVVFKPGIGVVRYTREMSHMGQPLLKMQQISTLIRVHLE